MPFNSTGPHYCTKCPPTTRKTKKGPMHDYVTLKLVESNFSGCGVDIAECPKCNRVFEISYVVADMIDVTKKWRV